MSKKGVANPTVIIRRSGKNYNQSSSSVVDNPAYVKAKWKFIEWNTLLVVIPGSMRPESMSYSIVDPAIYSSVLQRLEYPIFGAIHRELFNSFLFWSNLHGIGYMIYRISHCVCEIYLNWALSLLFPPACAQFSK